MFFRVKGLLILTKRLLPQNVFWKVALWDKMNYINLYTFCIPKSDIDQKPGSKMWSKTGHPFWNGTKTEVNILLNLIFLVPFPKLSHGPKMVPIFGKEVLKEYFFIKLLTIYSK